jgi:hypothetical protein
VELAAARSGERNESNPGELEGTAEAFAASLFGEDMVGFFITEFDPQGFETASRLIGKGLYTD